ncbi:hypothetical protein RCL_jg25258.t1 [Rhizophagus clarus]|uniref:Reverse transcriptase domain-containing protein n=1 Tax=Rhizophagus clarus TaxID=94130 RepID=A0A8H3QAY3_9GLOM|nr:hypothetical protein RCL_jg25258.t1 [Rhizophagus clarus]
MLSTIDSKPQDVQPVIKIDHRIIILDLFMDDIITNKNNIQKCQPPLKTIFYYDEMQKTDGDWNWDKFNKDISENLDDPNIKLTINKIRGINTQKQLNQLWNSFRKVIINSAKINIKQKKKKIKLNHHLLYDSDLKRDLNMLKGMLNKICKEKLDFNDRTIENRKKIIFHITALYIRSDYNKSSNLSDFISIMKRLNITISNKKKMIKSVLDHLYTSLSIDKVLYFQMVAGAINCEKDLSQHPEWQDQYQPKHDVQHNIYNDLMKYPTLDEWIDNTTNPSFMLSYVKDDGTYKTLIKFYQDDIQPFQKLTKSKQRKLGYTLEVLKIALNKFYSENTSEQTEKLMISSSAYMDDTQWLAPSQNNLEEILEIADSYKLNNIQVNKEKSELLVRYK